MTTATRTENDALIEALQVSSEPDELEPGKIYGYKLADGVKIVDLLDRDREEPLRKTGTVRVDDAASFIHYFKKHADNQSEVYVDLDRGVFTAVLNAHEGIVSTEYSDTPRWEDHRLVLTLALTDAWKRWTGIDRQMLKQAAFADFIDDNRADIRKPAAADMLEMVQHFQALTKVTFASSIVLANGDRKLTYSEETEAGTGPKHSLPVPSELQLGIAPFDDSVPYEVNARFRYRIQSGALYMGVLFDNADDVRRDAVKTVVAKLSEELGITIMRGTPA